MLPLASDLSFICFCFFFSIKLKFLSVFIQRIFETICYHRASLKITTHDSIRQSFNMTILCIRFQIVFAREYTQAENQTWHVQHFCCWYCDAPLAGLRYIAQQNNPYCVRCFDRLYSKVRKYESLMQIVEKSNHLAHNITPVTQRPAMRQIIAYVTEINNQS